MKQWLYALIFRVPFTIDRIENQWVIVEWANMALTTIWKGHFPLLPQEGKKGIANIWLCHDPQTIIIGNDPLTFKRENGASVIPYPIFSNDNASVCMLFELDEKHVFMTINED